MFKNPFFLKLFFLGVWSVLLNIPMLCVNNLISTRQQQHAAAVESIGESAARAQTINGPYLIQPYTVNYFENTTNKDGSVTKVQKFEQKQQYLLPKKLTIGVAQTSQIRKRGIFSGLLYHTEQTIDAEFLIPDGAWPNLIKGSYTLADAYFSLGVGDSRGMQNTPSLQCHWQDESATSFTWLPGAKNSLLNDGIHSQLGELKSGRTLSCSIKLALNGTQSLHFMPLAEANVIQVHADWPHPKFSGNQLPVEHDISEQGFSARWESTHFAVNIADALAHCLDNSDCQGLKERAFGVEFVEPVNSYTVAYRAVTYAMLFMLLTFGACFLFEILTKQNIHPMQYSLISAAMTMFYILLLALGEHMNVLLAYSLAAAACVGLLSIYLTAVLGSIKRGIYASVGFAVLYGLLLCVLQSEDYALIFGSSVLFAALALFMLLTRHLNWSASIKRSRDPIEPAKVEV
ncbi:MAG TPA: cell envelope integrity protein CreD [Cellvibrionaceae bacterium]